MSESLLDLLEAPFHVVRLPHFRLKLPTLPQLSPMTIFSLVFLSYFLVISGVIYDVIVEPPSIGTIQDERGMLRPQVFLKYRVNGQYMIEGLSAGMMFALGAIGVILLDRANQRGLSERTRYAQIVAGVLLMGMAYVVSLIFVRIKIPGYGIW